jgi:hypothetical protein
MKTEKVLHCSVDLAVHAPNTKSQTRNAIFKDGRMKTQEDGVYKME